MSESTKRGLLLLAIAAGLGIAGDVLLRAEDLGLNGFLLIAGLAGAFWAAGRRFGLTGEGRWMLLPVVLFASGLLWRDSPMLRVLDVLAILISLGLATLYARGGELRRAGLIDYALGLVVAGAKSAFGLLPLLAIDIKWAEVHQGERSTRVAAIVRGLLLAVPLLLLFGALFMSADAVFAKMADDLITFNLEDLVGHLLVIALLTWGVGGLLRTALLDEKTAPPAVGKPAFASMGAIEMGMVLGLLNLLFLAFVLVQFRYFFGGAAMVVETTGLTYAEYARRGFFELVWVSALVLPLLLLGHWLLPEGRPAQVRLFRWLSGSLVGLLFVIMASALRRMMLYQGEFGLTELRLYTTAFMGWLALLFVAFLVTVLRERRERFAFAALVSGLAVLAGLHVINPDALITGTNVRLAASSGRPLDVHYVATLSGDSVPVLVEALPSLSEQEQGQVRELVLKRWSPEGPADWRAWNWGRWQAQRAVSR